MTVFERGAAASGASVRNFGMIWPIGQPAGEAHAIALRSREAWLELARDAGLWVQPCGSIHLAHQDDEWGVLEEFASVAAGLGYTVELLDTAGVLRRTDAANPDGLKADCSVRPNSQSTRAWRCAHCPGWLASRLGVRFEFRTTITHVESGRVRGSCGHAWSFDRTIVCGGADFETLFPEICGNSGLRAASSRC